MKGEIGPEISSLSNLKEFYASENCFTSIDLSLFLLESLEFCDISENPHLKQPPAFEAEEGIIV